MPGANGKGFCASFLADDCGPSVFATVTNSATFACCCSYHWRLDVILLDSPLLLLVAQSLRLQCNPLANAAAALSVFP